MGYVYEQAVGTSLLERAPEPCDQRVVKVDFRFVDYQDLLLGHAEHLGGKVEHGTLAVTHLWCGILGSRLWHDR
jgi:hypothetical protein